MALKIVHSQKVAEISKQLAIHRNCSAMDVDLAEVTGLYHDIGRFEQIRQYHTFIDWKSVDHAKLSTVVLFGPKRDADKILEALPLPCQLADFREFTDLEGLIYFTDGDGNYPKKQPDYLTAFVFLDKGNLVDAKVPSWAIKYILDKDEIINEQMVEEK